MSSLNVSFTVISTIKYTSSLFIQIMMIFGTLTIRNIQQSVKRVNSENIQIETISLSLPKKRWERQKITNRQCVQMMIVQCIYFSLTTLAVPIQWIKQSIRSYILLDSITGACTSFYLFTLSSQLFRHELMLLFIDQVKFKRQNTINNRHHRPKK